MCALPSMSDKRVEFRHLLSQVNFFCEQVLALQDFRRFETLTVGNNGSILDSHTFPPSVLFYLMARSRLLCPHLRRLSLITRPEYVTDAILGCLMEEVSTYSGNNGPGESRSLDIEITVGLEALSPKANEEVRKGFGQAEIEDLLARLQRWNKMSQIADGKTSPKLSFRAYFLLKPYPLSDDEAVEDVIDGMRFLAKLQSAYEVKTAMHLNPVYVAAGTKLETHYNHGEYLPPKPELIGRTLLEIRALWEKMNPTKVPGICLGLSDEGMALPRGSFVPSPTLQAHTLWQALREFNAFDSDRKLEAFALVESAMIEGPAGR
jgi:uncharacterized Fe-S cluster-containing MiaB family protein